MLSLSVGLGGAPPAGTAAEEGARSSAPGSHSRTARVPLAGERMSGPGFTLPGQLPSSRAPPAQPAGRHVGSGTIQGKTKPYACSRIPAVPHWLPAASPPAPLCKMVSTVNATRSSQNSGEFPGQLAFSSASVCTEVPGWQQRVTDAPDAFGWGRRKAGERQQ